MSTLAASKHGLHKYLNDPAGTERAGMGGADDAPRSCGAVSAHYFAY